MSVYRPTASTSADAAPATEGRLHWVDVAKAAAIILVVAYHTGGAGMNVLFPNPDGPGSAFWAGVNQVLLPMRMPLFFLAAGLLAHRAVTRSWFRVWRPRVLVLLWPYLLWSIAFAGFAGFAYRPEDPASYAVDRLQDIPVAGSPYWFLAVLALFFVTAKLLRRWAVLVLAATLALAVAAPFLEAAIHESLPQLVTYAAVKVSRYAFWYFLGCFGFRFIRRAADLNPWWVIVVGGVLFGVLTRFTWSGDLAAPFGFLLSASGLTAAVGASVIAARNQRIRSWSEYIAGRTLPIYLLHPVLINLVVLLALVEDGPLGPNDLLATLLTPLLVVLCVLVSVTVYDRVRDTRLEWIYRLPERGVRGRRTSC